MIDRISYLMSGLLLLFLCSGCDWINPEEELPVYLQLEAPLVRVDPGGSFAATAGLKDIWIERGGELLGIYQVPSIVPIYPSDEKQITLSAGVFNAGLSGFRQRYPFIKTQTWTLDVVPLDTMMVAPVFEYFAKDTHLIFAFEEKFEGVSLLIQRDQTRGGTVNLSTSSDAFQGGRAGQGSFFPGDSLMEWVSVSSFRLPQSGENQVFIEISYKNDIAFTAGLHYQYIHDIQQGSLGGRVFFSPSSGWKTVYIDMGTDLRTLVDDARFLLFLRANGKGQQGRILFDNIRLLHFTP